ncbi:MAG TPA: alpha/beta fold hydrolase [Opitutales bacterium]|nr:alpha/beta fold hydrolase [Opitutales bacterium]
MATQRANTTILALHGFTGGGADFAPFAKLCGGNWHFPNLPGHGPNPQLDCTPEATLRLVEKERSTLNSRHSRPNILLGYSMGARAALLHAVSSPRQWDALVLISPNPGIEAEAACEERKAVDEKLAQRIESEGVDSFIEFWQNTPMIRSQKKIRPDWREPMQALRKEHRAEGLAASLRQFGQGQCPNLWPELHKIKLPTLLIGGRKDAKYAGITEKMAHLLPDATLEILDGAGHMPHLEDPEICAGVIGNFLNKVI